MTCQGMSEIERERIDPWAEGKARQLAQTKIDVPDPKASPRLKVVVMVWTRQVGDGLLQLSASRSQHGRGRRSLKLFVLTADTVSTIRNVACPTLQSSYMAHPIMCSATMTGPEMENTTPLPSGSSLLSSPLEPMLAMFVCDDGSSCSCLESVGFSDRIERDCSLHDLQIRLHMRCTFGQLIE